ncbi:hypothetical protein FQN57_003865 [Myotisia sp. PD_48]|nr:hypothetical protein FQN57_003865 [Myotisia sp. PD_48]
MPAPLAKGIVLTVTVLVAVGIAVYENPEIKRWLQSSRRKIAVALHNLGDGINPDKPPTSQQDDISMTEEIGPDAEQRRQKARDDIARRRALLEARQRNRSGSSIGSFDALVDKDGRLKVVEPLEQVINETEAKATGVDVSKSVQLPIHRGGEGSRISSQSNPGPSSNIGLEQQTAPLNSINTDVLQRSSAESGTPSHHSSELLAGLTPTSDQPDFDFGDRGHETSSSSSHTVGSFVHPEDGEADFYYAHPHVQNQVADQPGSFLFDNLGNNQSIGSVSSTPSIASSLSHIQHDPFETASDGSISDLGHRDEVYTPTSWSEVGSVISSNDGSQS